MKGNIYIYIYIVDMRNIITVMAVLIAIQIMSWKETCDSNRYCEYIYIL